MTLFGRLVVVAIWMGALGVAEGAPAGMQDGGSARPTFTKDIAPIIFARCSSCHRPGEAAPFQLLTFADVKARGRQIVTVTKSHYMPPWKPEPGYGDFVGERRLTTRELDLLERWVAAGAVEGDPADLPTPPAWTPGWQLGQPDLVVQMPEPFQLPADGPDVFRKFVVPIPLTEAHFVKAVEFRPSSRVVHHASVLIDPADSSRRLDAQDPAPGYEGLFSVTAKYPDGHFLGWTPGQLPPIAPDTAWRLERNTDLVLELHMRPSGKPELIQPAVGLFFTDRPPSRIPSIIRLGRQSTDIAPGDARYVTTDSYTLPVDVDLYAVQAHAHYVAKEIKGTARLPDGTTKWLLYIKDWDFNWQDQYRNITPLRLPRGTVVTMEFVYDNSADNVRNPSRPPRRVTWGMRTTDEMGDLWLQVVAHNETDRAQLNRDIGDKMMREDINGYEMVLRNDPGNAGLHDNLALLYVGTGNSGQALAHFEASARLQPQSAVAHYNLATALTRQGRLPEALVEFRQALAINPSRADAHNNLGAVLESLGRLDEAAAEYRLALVNRPEYADAHNNLGNVLRAQGQTEAAVAEYRQALQFRPDWAPVLSALAWLLATSGEPAPARSAEAVQLAERAATVAIPQTAVVLDTLAAAYAAAGQFDRAVIAAREALRLAATERAGRLTDDIRARLTLYEQRKPFRLNP